MTRSLPPLKLSRSPLVTVLCQIQFQAILAMKDYVPRIQDALRKKGYPVFRAELIQEFVFDEASKDAEMAPRRTLWKFFDKDQSRVLILSETFATLQVSEYSSFEAFYEYLEDAFHTIASAVEGLNVVRTGLRYIDAISTDGENEWKRYVEPGLHGVSSKVTQVGTDTQFHQTAGKTKNGIIAVRLFVGQNKSFLPPDLSAVDLRFKMPKESNAPSVMLDLDHGSHEAFELPREKEPWSQQLWALHDALDIIFREDVVTDFALEQWK